MCGIHLDTNDLCCLTQIDLQQSSMSYTSEEVCFVADYLNSNATIFLLQEERIILVTSRMRPENYLLEG